MSSILEIGNNKIKCQKFTPQSLVEEMLELIGYNGDLLGKKILENSFGSGCIIKAIVERYISQAEKKGIPASLISSGLSKDIWGIELDEQLYSKCLQELDLIVNQHGLPSVNWNLHNTNALSYKFSTSFDYIIGNPPYISYKEIDDDSREYIKENFTTCRRGKYDYCYAFIELGVKLLNDRGKLVQLIPNNIYKNVFAQDLRQLILDHVSVIHDYPGQKFFGDTMASISIFLYDKCFLQPLIQYRNKTTGIERTLQKERLGSKWRFDSAVKNYPAAVRFGDAFRVEISVATLCNKAFLVEKGSAAAKKIEPSILREAASPKSQKSKKEYLIIFPYRYDHGKIEHYSQEAFESLFPEAVKHLRQFSNRLSLRDMDENALWFEYGRSQALSSLNCEKLLMSTVITNTVEVYKLDNTTVPFSGLFISANKEGYSIDDAFEILGSKDFLEYVQGIGISVSGTSVRITCKDVRDYRFSWRERQ